jgi:IS4 transposase
LTLADANGLRPAAVYAERIVSNDLDASAQAIADLYKKRWGIELFFRSSFTTSSAPARRRA